MVTCGSDPIVRAWLRDHKRRNLSSGTIEKRESAARRLSQHAGKPLLEVSRDEIEAWLDSRPKISARTRYTEISHIAAFFKWAVREEYTEHDPTVRITRPKVRAGLPRPIATEDLRRAIDQAPTAELAGLEEVPQGVGGRAGRTQRAGLRRDEAAPHRARGRVWGGGRPGG